MLAPCEVAVKCLMPSVRAMIAKELMNRHKLKQSEAAKLLGVSQPAISLYYRKIRGKAITLEGDADITKLIENMSDSLVVGDLSSKDHILMLCRICRAARAKGLMCDMHKALEPSIDTEKCELCLSTKTPRCL